MGEMRNAYKAVVGNPKEKRQLKRLWRRWEESFEMICEKIGSEGVDWIYLAKDRDR
jgi:hypothetical protein